MSWTSYIKPYRMKSIKIFISFGCIQSDWFFLYYLLSSLKICKEPRIIKWYRNTKRQNAAYLTISSFWSHRGKTTQFSLLFWHRTSGTVCFLIHHNIHSFHTTFDERQNSCACFLCHFFFIVIFIAIFFWMKQNRNCQHCPAINGVKSKPNRMIKRKTTNKLLKIYFLYENIRFYL